ncbi:MAG: hemerythrin domain-containing protein [Chloroflexota bacterium]
MSEATEQLMGEHRAIERVIGLMGLAADSMDAGANPEPVLIGKGVSFFRDFVDKCHHAKEEHALFPAMEQRGVPRQAGPIGAMLADHEAGRVHVRAMAAALPAYEANEPDARATMSSNIKGYARVLKAHIQKEDNVLFPLSDRVLDEPTKAALFEEFERIEREETGPGEHEKHLSMIEEMQAKLA